MAKCSECDAKSFAKGLCKKHYNKQYRKRYYAEHREQAIADAIKANKSFRQQFPDEYRQRQNRYAQDWRKRVLNYYNNKCECCGETEPLFLAIDHVNGNGRQHHKKVGNGQQFYRIVLRDITNGHADRYRILCHNCNHGRYLNGGVCPHKMMLEEGSENG